MMNVQMWTLGNKDDETARVYQRIRQTRQREAPHFMTPRKTVGALERLGEGWRHVWDGRVVDEMSIREYEILKYVKFSQKYFLAFTTAHCSKLIDIEFTRDWYTRNKFVSHHTFKRKVFNPINPISSPLIHPCLRRNKFTNSFSSCFNFSTFLEVERGAANFHFKPHTFVSPILLAIRRYATTVAARQEGSQARSRKRTE